MAARNRTAKGKHDALGLFIELSSLLVGETVARIPAQRHFSALKSADSHQLHQVLVRFRQLKAAGGDTVRAVQDKLANDAALGPAVKSIMILWFTGQLQLGLNAAAAATGDDYFQALMWSCIGSHPPALSDGYFGHWRYPPDTGV